MFVIKLSMQVWYTYEMPILKLCFLVSFEKNIVIVKFVCIYFVVVII